MSTPHSDALRPGPFPFIPSTIATISIHVPTEGYHYPKAPFPGLGVSGHTSSLPPSSHVSLRSLHLEKRLIKQKIEEHKISLQALEEQLVDVENSIASTTHAVGSLHCYMDQVGVPIPDMAEHVAAPILFSEDGDSDSESQDGPGDDDDARGQSSAGVDAYWANECQHRPARRTSTGIVSGKIDLEARISTHGQPAAAAART
ncbi:hypothetical protein EDB84DRAFT_1445269 [Lactarius hengduanensis]|nr:hypothetical protein EDB84DRAFT_1445269 [Lactarius hengduanensis]